jgi:uncharacterized membrane protein|tara:strand:- start:2102 stop:2413 length:312 start_codon:yes stop_codon:yes gene_type:complete
MITNQLHWAAVIGLIFIVGGLKWTRVKKNEKDDEIEYDDRVSYNIQRASLQTFSISIILLFIYLLFSEIAFDHSDIVIDYLLIYLVVTLALAYYIVPTIVKRR